jgi:exonuclease SbcC
MLIKSVELENIRSYVHEKIEFLRENSEFGSGLVFLEGDIGAGKSTILMAIKFALFGKSGGMDYSELLREGAREGRVRLCFQQKTESGWKEYTIERGLARNKKGKIEQLDVKIGINEEVGVLSDTEANKEILKILGMNELRVEKKKYSTTLYDFALYVPQESMKEIMTSDKESRERRRAIIGKIFGTDIYTRARENAKMIAKKMDDEAKAIMMRLGEDYAEFERKEEELKEESKVLEEMKAELTAISDKVRERTAVFKRIEAELEKLEAMKDKLEELKREKLNQDTLLRKEREEMERQKLEASENEKAIEECTAELKALMPEYEEFLKLKDLVDAERKKREEYRNLDSKRVRADTQINALKEQIASMEKEVAEKDQILARIGKLEDIDAEITALREEENAIEGKIAVLQGDIERLENEIREKTKEKEEFSKLSGEKYCPKCKQELKPEHLRRMLEDIDGDIDRNRKEIAEKKKELENARGRKAQLLGLLREKEKAQKEKVKLEQKLREIESKCQKIEEVSAKVKGLEKQMHEIKESIQKLGFDEDKFKEYEGKLQGMEKIALKKRELETRVKELERKRNALAGQVKGRELKIHEIEKKIGEVTEKLEVLRKEYDAEEHRRKKIESDNLKTELGEMRGKMAEMERSIEDRRKRCEELAKEIEKLAKLRDYVEKLKAYISFFAYLGSEDGVYARIAENLLRDARCSLEQNINEFLRELMGNYDMVISLDEDFYPEIKVGEYIRAFSTLSGGEGTALSLAYRLALNKVISSSFFKRDTGILILDEPTDGFSSEQIISLKELLYKIKNENPNQQIIVVSHENELEGAADIVYEVVKYPAGTHVKMKGA